MKLILNALLVVSLVRANIFDDDSDFMKGFETGIIMRSKDSKIEEFGCSVPSKGKSDLEAKLGLITTAMETIKPFLPDNVDLENAYTMVIEFIDGISHLLLVFDPKTSKLMDDYCRGMVFGLHGFNMLVRIATINRSLIDTELDFLPSKDGKRVIKKRKNKAGQSVLN